MVVTPASNVPSRARRNHAHQRRSAWCGAGLALLPLVFVLLLIAVNWQKREGYFHKRQGPASVRSTVDVCVMLGRHLRRWKIRPVRYPGSK